MNKLLMGLLLGVAGCGHDADAVIVTPSSVSAVDDAQAVTWEAGLLWLAAAPIDPDGAVDVHAIVAATPPALANAFVPRGCAHAAGGGNQITLELHGCNGAFGLIDAIGTVTFAFGAASTGGVEIVATSDPLRAGTASLTIDAVGVLGGSGSSRLMTVTTDGGGTGPNGTSVARHGAYTLAWTSGAGCAALNGAVRAGPTDLTGEAERTAFAAVTACAQGCPRSGTVTQRDTQSGATTTTTYDGTATVAVTSSTGQRGSATLVCD